MTKRSKSFDKTEVFPNSGNWLSSDVPKSGWALVQAYYQEELRKCDMCLRTKHKNCYEMEHPDRVDNFIAGEDCATRMSGMPIYRSDSSSKRQFKIFNAAKGVWREEFYSDEKFREFHKTIDRNLHMKIVEHSKTCWFWVVSWFREAGEWGTASTFLKAKAAASNKAIEVERVWSRTELKDWADKKYEKEKERKRQEAEEFRKKYEREGGWVYGEIDRVYLAKEDEEARNGNRYDLVKIEVDTKTKGIVDLAIFLFRLTGGGYERKCHNRFIREIWNVCPEPKPTNFQEALDAFKQKRMNGVGVWAKVGTNKNGFYEAIELKEIA